MYIVTTTPKFLAKVVLGAIIFVPVGLLFVVSLFIAAIIGTPIYLILVGAGALIDDAPVDWVLDWWAMAYSVWGNL